MRCLRQFGPLFLVCLSARSALPQIRTGEIERPPNYDAFIPPAAGSFYEDPVFGSTIKRITNALSTPNHDGVGNLPWIEQEYASVTPFNNDNSRFILVHVSYFALYDGAGTYLNDLPLEMNSSSEPRWSRKDNVTLYYHSGNQLKSYDTSNRKSRLVHTFSQYSLINSHGEMDISYDGDHLSYVGDNRYIFVYEISTDRTSPVFDSGGQPFNSMRLTPNNNVIMSWLPTGATRFTGEELFDINMTYQRQVAHADGHKAVTRDTNGDEVMIWSNSDDPLPLANCRNGLVKIRLSDARQTCLLQLDWSLAVHLTAADQNGLVYVDTENGRNLEPNDAGWVVFTNEILQVNLDGSGFTRLAHHRSRPVDTYNWQPKVSSSRDGTRMLFASNYNLTAISAAPFQYADTYLLTPPPFGPPATTRYEQNSAPVTYSGTWFPNASSLDSAGTAAMAVDPGAGATFAFFGTGVNWIGNSDQWSGTAQVFLDGVLKSTVDTYAPQQDAQKIEYSVAGLSNGAHILRILATGARNSVSAGAWIWVDAFDVTASIGATSISGVVNAASFAPGPLTANSYASLFGVNLARNVNDTGTTVAITDAKGNSYPETLIYTSPGQLNFLIPDGLSSGAGTLTVTESGQSTSIAVTIANSAPGLFSANGSGQGAAAAQAAILTGDGSVNLLPVAQCGLAGCGAVTIPMNGASVYLVLYGTGARSAKKATVTIGGVPSTITYLGAQGTYPGLDQINVLVPGSLQGRGEVDVILTGDGSASNAVKARF